MPEEDPFLRHLVVETPESVSVTYRLAGLGSRGAAALVDGGLLLLIVSAEIVLGIFVAFGALRLFGEAASQAVIWIAAAVIAAVFITYWGYFIAGEVAGGGRTPGKRVMGIRVIRDDGSRVGVIDSIIRNLVRAIDFMPGTYAVGIVSILLSQQGKRLGDMAASTAVIEDRGQEHAAAPYGAEVDERVSLVVEYLERREEMTSDARYQVAVTLLSLWGEDPGGWDEPTVAGRLADLAGLRHTRRALASG